jgi:hypothetical protein
LNSVFLLRRLSLLISSILKENGFVNVMKKILIILLFLVLLFASFRGGTWYSQRWKDGSRNAGEEHLILHYVDPMNPANVSDKPGIAPCGMPMEPVYGEPEGADVRGGVPPGTVKITAHKQQIIGVQVGVAERVSETHTIRTLDASHRMKTGYSRSFRPQMAGCHISRRARSAVWFKKTSSWP